MALRLLSRMQRVHSAVATLRPLAVRAPAVSAQLGLRLQQAPHAAASPQRRWPHLALQRSLHVTPLAASSSEGPITSDLIANMRQKIATALETDLVEVQDMQGDGRHVEIVVVSKLFDGKSAVARQRMVYKAIWEELQDTVHAVDAMVTRTPEEAGV